MLFCVYVIRRSVAHGSQREGPVSRKIVRASEAINEPINPGGWVAVFACDPIGSSVVNTHSQCAIFLFHK